MVFLGGVVELLKEGVGGHIPVPGKASFFFERTTTAASREM